MSSTFIDIEQMSYANKGDCLMLLATIDALTSRLGTIGFATRSNEPTASELESYGLGRLIYPRAARLMHARGRLRGSLLATGWLGRVIARRRGGVAFADVSAVLHMSGYAHGDRWGARAIEEDIALVRDARSKGKKVIFMPKTYGPFDQTRASARALLKLPDLVFVRDRRSYDSLIELGMNEPDLHLVTDYTGACQGISAPMHEHLANRGCIIPNFRVVDMLPDNQLERYVEFLSRLSRHLNQCGLNPFLLVHETASDPQIAEQMGRSTPLEIVSEPDPLKLKGIIGQSRLVVSSRLHGAINGLSQAVPTIAIGWAHKYSEIMDQYGVPDYNVPWSDDALDEVAAAIDRLIGSPAEDSRVRAALHAGQSRIDVINDRMWDTIAREIGNA